MQLHTEAFEVGDEGGRVERGRLRVHSRARQLEAGGPRVRSGVGRDGRQRGSGRGKGGGKGREGVIIT